MKTVTGICLLAAVALATLSAAEPEDLPFLRLKRGYDASAGLHRVSTGDLPAPYVVETGWYVMRESRPGTQLLYECSHFQGPFSHTFLSTDVHCEGYGSLGSVGYVFTAAPDLTQASFAVIFRCSKWVDNGDGRGSRLDHLVSENCAAEGYTNEGPFGWAGRIPNPVDPAPYVALKRGSDGTTHWATSQWLPPGYNLDGRWWIPKQPSSEASTVFYECRWPQGFVSSSLTCEGATRVARLGSFLDSAGFGRVPIYRCHAAIGDYMISESPTCESPNSVDEVLVGDTDYVNEGLLGYAYRYDRRPIPAVSPASIVWRNLFGTSASGSTLTKTADTWVWDAGASSSSWLLAGDGYAEFAATERTGYRMFGLSHGDSNQNYVDIDFAIYLAGDGTFAVYESGTSRGVLGSYATGDRFRVEVAGGVVRYLHDGAIFYTSALTPVYPLLADTSFAGPGSTVADAILAGVSVGRPAPEARMGQSYEGFVGQALKFDARDSQGLIAQYDWVFGDGSTASGNMMASSHAYATPGSFTARLRITDPDGRSSTTTVPVSIRPAPPSTPVLWVSHTNTTAVGNELRRVSGAGWDAGAISTRSIGSGDGYVECIAGETATNFLMFGLSHGDADAGYADIDFALGADGAATLHVFEGGVHRGAVGSYEAGDVLRVEIRDGAVRYLRNGRVLYVSTVTPTYPLLIDTSIYYPVSGIKAARIAPTVNALPVARVNGPSSAVVGAPISFSAAGSVDSDGAIASYAWTFSDGGTATGPNVVHTFASVGPHRATLTVTDNEQASQSSNAEVQVGTFSNAVWRNLVGVVSEGNSLTKTSSVAEWESGAVSSDSLLSGDGYAEFTATETNTTRAFGLSKGDGGASYSDIDFAIFLTTTDGTRGTFGIFEGVFWRGSFGEYAAGDRFRVEVGGGVVRYARNGTVFYTSSVAPAYPLLIDTSLHTPGATITNAVLVGMALGTPALRADAGLAYDGWIGVRNFYRRGGWPEGDPGGVPGGEDPGPIYTTDENEYVGPVQPSDEPTNVVCKLFLSDGVFSGVPRVPFFELRNEGTPVPYWTSDANRRADLLGAGWHDAGIGGYVLVSQASGTVELSRLVSMDGRYAWTADDIEREALKAHGWRVQGVEGYVWPAAFKESVQFDGRASEGRIVRYDWAFGDGTTSSGATVKHAYTYRDRHTPHFSPADEVRLTVTDENNATSTITVPVTIRRMPPNDAVTWTALANAAVVGEELRRPSGHGNDAGAASAQTIPSGDGYVETTVAETNTYRIFGLSHGDTDPGYADIDYGFYLDAGGTVTVMEAGTWRPVATPYATDDVLRIEVWNGAVRYFKNGRLLYVSTVPPTYPLLVDTNLYSAGATIKAARISRPVLATPTLNPAGGSFSEPVTVTLQGPANAAVYYTTDGSEPSASSALYLAPITLTQSAIVRAKAVGASSISSTTAAATLEFIALPPVFSPSPVALPPGAAVTLTTPTAGAAIRYTADGSEPTLYSTLYTGPVTLTSSTTLRAKTFKDGWTASETVGATYTPAPPDLE